MCCAGHSHTSCLVLTPVYCCTAVAASRGIRKHARSPSRRASTHGRGCTEGAGRAHTTFTHLPPRRPPPQTRTRSPRTTLTWFFTDDSVRPGRSPAISIHLWGWARTLVSLLCSGLSLMGARAQQQRGSAPVRLGACQHQQPPFWLLPPHHPQECSAFTAKPGPSQGLPPLLTCCRNACAPQSAAGPPPWSTARASPQASGSGCTCRGCGGQGGGCIRLLWNRSAD